MCESVELFRISTGKYSNLFDMRYFSLSLSRIHFLPFILLFFPLPAQLMSNQKNIRKNNINKLQSLLFRV